MSSRIEVANEGAIAVIKLGGRIIAEGNISLRKELDTFSAVSGRYKAVDLSAVEYIDSHALGQVLFCCSILQKNGQKMFIVNNSEDSTSYISRLIEICELNQVAPIVKTADEIVTD